MTDYDYADYISRLFELESGGSWNPPTTGSNKGAGQFGPKEEAEFGINDQNRTNPDTQIAAVRKEMERNQGPLTQALGQDPTPAQLYMAHQQGQAGAIALYEKPDTAAWQAIRPYYDSDKEAISAIRGNLPPSLKRADVNTLSSSAFTSAWEDRYATIQPGRSLVDKVNTSPATAAT
jgi:lysophospholipase L1-like esterase